MGRLRLATLIVCGLALGLVVFGLVAAAYFAPPREYSAFRGVQVQGARADTVTTILPRHGLACVEGQGTPLTTTCRVTVGAMPLVVTMTRPAPGRWAFSSCTATYGQRSVPCHAGFPPYAVVNGASLGITPAALAALRPAWSPEGWDGAIWRRAFLALAALAGLGLAALALNVPLAHPLGRVAVAVATGLTTFFFVAPFLGLVLDAFGYVD
jgi:hypothetical protein